MKKPHSPILRYHGAKFRLAPWIMSFFPAHLTYVEPFGGAAGVLMQKSRSKIEVYNDIDGDVVNLFSVLRDRQSSEQLQEMVRLTPYSRDEFALAFKKTNDHLERARRILVRAYMGFGSAGATKETTGFRIDSRPNKSTGSAMNKWRNFPDFILDFTSRLQGVVIENRPAIEVINSFDSPDTLFFIDPPYVLKTRCNGGNGNYKHEMSDDDHVELLDRLKNVDGMVVLSGYDNDIYQGILSGWRTSRTRSRVSAQRGTRVAIETVWLNSACEDKQLQLVLV